MGLCRLLDHRPRAPLGLLALLIVAFSGSPSSAQGPGAERRFPAEFPFLPGSQFFEQFFGLPGAEEAQKLAQIEISEREEREYGERVREAAWAEFKRRKIPLTQRGDEAEYLRELVEQLHPQMTHRKRYRTIQVWYGDTDLADAYSIPGGTIIVFRGMMEMADSEAALVATLGHELSHLDRQHQLLPLKRLQLSRRQATNVPQDPSAMFRQLGQFMAVFLKPFRPEDEIEADQDGATWAYRAGYDPRALSLMFARLNERDPLGKFAPPFLRTHPYHVDRQTAIEDRYRQLQAVEPRKDLYLGRENLQQRIPRDERRFPD